MTQPQGQSRLIEAFQYAAAHFPFYTKILQKKGIDPASIKTEEDFLKVPVIFKEDVFPAFGLKDICQNGQLGDFVSAIVSSGTSGVFSYGLLTAEDIVEQKKMVDEFLGMCFEVEKYPPLIINALAMGVSFISSYPVIPTSVRSDIVLHVINTFKNEGRQLVIVGDPHFIKKILEEGVEKGFVWKDIRISCAVGGTASSDSLLQYLLALLNSRTGKAASPETKDTNLLFGTMGLTEIGLNIFSAMPDLIELRHHLQSNPPLMEKLFGVPLTVCPELMYYMPPRMNIEICNADERGVGDIVISHLDTTLKTMLIRYNTGDKGMKLNMDVLTKELGIALPMPLPIMAIFGRAVDTQQGALSPALVKEMLYRDHTLAASITGHFVIKEVNGTPTVRIQLKPGLTGGTFDGAQISIPGATGVGVPYREFERDVELTYETKWKHLS